MHVTCCKSVLSHFYMISKWLMSPKCALASWYVAPGDSVKARGCSLVREWGANSPLDRTHSSLLRLIHFRNGSVAMGDRTQYPQIISFRNGLQQQLHPTNRTQYLIILGTYTERKSQQTFQTSMFSTYIAQLLILNNTHHTHTHSLPFFHVFHIRCTIAHIEQRTHHTHSCQTVAQIFHHFAPVSSETSPCGCLAKAMLIRHHLCGLHPYSRP